MHHDIDLIAGAAVGLRRFATSSYLKRAVKQINGLYYGVHCAPHRDNSAVSLFKYSFLTSVIVSSSSSLPSIPPRLVFFSDESDSPGPWLFTSAMSVSALSRYYCFSFLIFCLFFFFFLETVFFFTRAFADAVSRYSYGSLPLLELAPLPDFWRWSKILTTRASMWHQRASCKQRTLPWCSTLTPRAAKLSDWTVSEKKKIQAGWGKGW